MMKNELELKYEDFGLIQDLLLMVENLQEGCLLQHKQDNDGEETWKTPERYIIKICQYNKKNKRDIQNI